MSVTTDPIPSTPASDGYTTAPRALNIPTNLRAPGVMSDTSLAVECFVGQRFSAKLQAYLISYNQSVYSDHPIYAI